MPKQKIKLPKYVFRGTTINFHGSENARSVPYTCTSFHPVKALWFALECNNVNPENSVVYLTQLKKVENFGIIYNFLSSYEDEIAFKVAPLEFYTYSEGYIHTADFQKVLGDFHINPNQLVRKDNLTRLCKESAKLSIKKIERIADSLLRLLKNN